MKAQEDPIIAKRAAVSAAKEAIEAQSGEALDKRYDAFNACEAALIKSKPKTIEGLIAQLRYALDEDLCGGQYSDGSDSAMFENAIAFLEAAAASALEEAIQARLQGFAVGAGVAPISKVITSDGAPSRELKTFCDEHNLTLDWCILGEGPTHRRAA